MGVYLPKPKTTKESEDGGDFPNTTTRFGLSAMQGWRQYMEDAHLADPSFMIEEFHGEPLGLFGVFDGHGGPAVSSWVSKEFSRILRCELLETQQGFENQKIISKRTDFNKNVAVVCEALQRTFLRLDVEMSDLKSRDELKKIHGQSEKKKRQEQEEDNSDHGGGVGQPGSLLDALLSGVGGQRPIIRVFECNGQKYYRFISRQFEDEEEDENGNEKRLEQEAKITEVEDEKEQQQDHPATTTEKEESDTLNEKLQSLKNYNETLENPEGQKLQDTAVSKEKTGGIVPTGDVSTKKDYETATASNESESWKELQEFTKSEDEEKSSSNGMEDDDDQSHDHAIKDQSKSNDESTSNIISSMTGGDEEHATVIETKHENEDEDDDTSRITLELANEGQPYQPESCGSTAIVVAIVGGENPYLVTANAGDSRAVLCRNGIAIPLSRDHKPVLRGETRRIMKAGGKVINGRVDGNLNLSRALGDLYYKNNTSIRPEEQKIISFPDVHVVHLDPTDEFAILACDGIWDCLSNQQAVDLVRKKLFDHRKEDYDNNVEENDEKTQAAVLEAKTKNSVKLSQLCEQICDLCISENPLESEGGIGCDNMTIMIVVFGEHLTTGCVSRQRNINAAKKDADQNSSGIETSITTDVLEFYGSAPDEADFEEFDVTWEVLDDPMMMPERNQTNSTSATDTSTENGSTDG